MCSARAVLYDAFMTPLGWFGLNRARRRLVLVGNQRRRVPHHALQLARCVHNDRNTVRLRIGNHRLRIRFALVFKKLDSENFKSMRGRGQTKACSRDAQCAHTRY